MKQAMKYALIRYCLDINHWADTDCTIHALIAKIRKAPSKNKAISLFKKHQNFLRTVRLVPYNQNQIVTAIKHNQGILDLFEIPYPSPPESIAHLFQPKTPNEEKHEDKKEESRRMKWSTGPNGFNKTNVETILQNIPKRPTQLTDLATGIRDIPKE